MSATLFATRRNGIVERLERGHCVLANALGTIVWSAGDPDHVTYMRSSAKPIQTSALILSGGADGFGLEPEHLAVCCGSHKGEPRHVRTVLDLLRRAGVPPSALQCGSHPLSEPVASRLARAGQYPTPLHNNCSGKHSGMLAAAAALGSPLGSYLDVDHPVQQLILQSVAQCAGVGTAQLHVGIDGCSAPNFALPMWRIARCFAQIATPHAIDGDLADAVQRTGAAMRAHPWLVSGMAGFDSLLMAAAPVPLVSKGGAEGLQCVAIPRMGLGLAIKFESGRSEGMGAVAIAILRGLGLFDAVFPDALRPLDQPPVRNHRGITVGDTQVLVDTATLPQLTQHLRSA